MELLGALLAEVALVRGTVQPVPPAQDDLADPVHGTQDDIRACVRTIQTALARWLSLVDINLDTDADTDADTEAVTDAVTDGSRSAAAHWASDRSAP